MNKNIAKSAFIISFLFVGTFFYAPSYAMQVEGGDEQYVIDIINDGPREREALQYDIIERFYATPKILKQKALEHFRFVCEELEEQGIFLAVQEIKDRVRKLLDISIEKGPSRLKVYRGVFSILCSAIDQVFYQESEDTEAEVQALVHEVKCLTLAVEPGDGEVVAVKKGRKKRRKKKKNSIASSPASTIASGTVASAVPSPIAVSSVCITDSEDDGCWCADHEEEIDGEQPWDKIKRLWAEIEAYKQRR